MDAETLNNWVNNVGSMLNTAAGVAGNIGATIQNLQSGTYQSQQQQQINQQQQQTKSNNIFMYFIMGFLGLGLLIKMFR